MRIATTIFLTSLAMPTMARDILLGLPIDCDLGETCYIQQYVDHDQTGGIRDFQCGSLTYDTHKGTDFALFSLADQQQGVAVIAAAPGTVVGSRNDMPDILQNGPDAPDVSNRECGNGVVIRHGGGWETQYCHLAQGSVTVQSGDRVAMGQTLGMVGLSGQTQFPHVHLSVRKDGQVIDPFAPNADSCGPTAETLWLDTPETPAGGVIRSGFATHVPAYDEIKDGIPSAPTLSAFQDMVLWGYAFGGLAGDQLQITITGPDGLVFENAANIDRTRALFFRAGGKRAPNTGWTAGDFTGTVTHLRDGAAIDSETITVTVQ